MSDIPFIAIAYDGKGKDLRPQFGIPDCCAAEDDLVGYEVIVLLPEGRHHLDPISQKQLLVAHKQGTRVRKDSAPPIQDARDRLG